MFSKNNSPLSDSMFDWSPISAAVPSKVIVKDLVSLSVFLLSPKYFPLWNLSTNFINRSLVFPVSFAIFSSILFARSSEMFALSVSFVFS